MAVNILWLDENAVDTSGTQITEINFGDIIRPGEATRNFKIGNSGTSIAEQVTVTADGADAEAVGWKSFSNDGTTFTASISLPDIAVDGITGVINVKTTVPADATTGTHSSNIKTDYIYA